MLLTSVINEFAAICHDSCPVRQHRIGCGPAALRVRVGDWAAHRAHWESAEVAAIPVETVQRPDFGDAACQVTVGKTTRPERVRERTEREAPPPME